MTPDCQPAVPGSVPGLNPAISRAYSGLPALRSLLSGMVLHCKMSSEKQQRRIYVNKRDSVALKTIRKKKPFIGENAKLQNNVVQRRHHLKNL